MKFFGCDYHDGCQALIEMKGGIVMSSKVLSSAELGAKQKIQMNFPRGMTPESLSRINSCPVGMLDEELRRMVARIDKRMDEGLLNRKFLSEVQYGSILVIKRRRIEPETLFRYCEILEGFRTLVLENASVTVCASAAAKVSFCDILKRRKFGKIQIALPERHVFGSIDMLLPFLVGLIDLKSKTLTEGLSTIEHVNNFFVSVSQELVVVSVRFDEDIFYLDASNLSLLLGTWSVGNRILLPPVN